MKTDFDALIIGAGVAGSSAAILLAQAGWSVALVEKRRFPRRKVCGECIAASNLPLLDALGIGEAFDRLAGAPLRRVGLFAGNHRMVAALPRYDHARHGWGRALGREHLDTLLLQRAAELGATIWQPWTVRTVSQDGDRHVCTAEALDSGESVALSASILIDAHGSWEPDPSVAQRRHVAAKGSDLFAFKGNFSGADLEADLLPVLAFPGGYGGMVLADNNVLTLACCIRRDTLRTIRARTPGLKAAAAVQAFLEASVLGVRQVLACARPEGAWLSAGPIRPGLRSPAPGPRQFAIGNAAGEAHPILGEGISMAIQSAWLLCGQLIPRREQWLAGGAGAQTGDAYASAWRRSFARRIRIAAVLSHLAMRPATGVLLPLLRRWPGLLTAAARLGGKIHCVVDPASAPFARKFE
ncbi:MAG: NAD(P)/FAD-dependent oxidoreductase [Dokdonella sp.]